MKKRNLLLIPAIAMLGSSLCSAVGLIYNVNYLGGGAAVDPTTNLNGVIGGGGQIWNQATFTNVNDKFTDIVDSTGGTSTIDISGIFGGNNASDALSGQAIFSGNTAIHNKGEDRTIQISQLTIGGYYDIYIYSLSHSTSSWGTTDTERSAGDFTTSNAVGNGTSQSLNNGILGTTAATFALGQNYVLFHDIVADGTGTISIVADAFDGVDGIANGVTGGIGDTRLQVNGMQIVSVPETSTAALLGLGGLALVLRRRK